MGQRRRPPPSVCSSFVGDVQPLRAGRTTALETEPVRSVSDELVEATLPHLPPVIADMARLQMVIGCHPGELCAIKPSMVERFESVWEIHLGKHKTAHRCPPTFPVRKHRRVTMRSTLFTIEQITCTYSDTNIFGPRAK